MSKGSDLGWEAEHEVKVALQTGGLAELGFGPAFDVGGTGSAFGLGFGGFQMASCLTCGAAVRLMMSIDEGDLQSQPVALHHRWHAEAST